MKEKEHLTGTIWRFADNIGDITADDGDWYSFRTKRNFQEGDRVSFDVAQSSENLTLAMMGGPIHCTNVKLIKGERRNDEYIEKLKPGSGKVNIFMISKPSESDPSV
jgi:hypothetical protein